MKVGFIGAGRMGFTLGKHLKDSGCVDLSGYYSRNPDSARTAAQFTDTKYYDDLEKILSESDVLFLTVPDGQISVMADVLDRLDGYLEGKILCHTSGALSSKVFSGIHSHIYGYSIHPIYAVSSKTESYKKFKESFITIEGHDRYLSDFVSLFEGMGHMVKVIKEEDKVRYHGAAVMASNLVIGLYHLAITELTKCGFSETEARAAINPLFINNANRLIDTDEKSALTGPVERCDTGTVLKHLDKFSGDSEKIYRLLSAQLLDIAKQKHGPSGSEKYNELERIIGG